MVDLIKKGFGDHPVTDSRTLDAMRRVPRHQFVPKPIRPYAYANRPLPIGYGQTISQPFIVAYMTQALKLNPDDRVLEIGTGSGYQAAILAELVKEVYTIEIVPELAKRAAETLSALNYANVRVRAGDGYRGWPEAAPFDAVIVTCAPEHIPKPLVEQLKEGGRMMIPVGGELESGSWAAQELILIRKTADGMKKIKAMDVRFVPMTGEAQGPKRTRPSK